MGEAMEAPMAGMVLGGVGALPDMGGMVLGGVGALPDMGGMVFGGVGPPALGLPGIGMDAEIVVVGSGMPGAPCMQGFGAPCMPGMGHGCIGAPAATPTPMLPRASPAPVHASGARVVPMPQAAPVRSVA